MQLKKQHVTADKHAMITIFRQTAELFPLHALKAGICWAVDFFLSKSVACFKAAHIDSCSLNTFSQCMFFAAAFWLADNTANKSA